MSNEEMPNGLRHCPRSGYLRWGGDGEAVQLEKGLAENKIISQQTLFLVMQLYNA
jgi:hypothetical protein